MALLVAVALTGAVAWSMSGFVKSPAQVASEASAPDPSLITAPVERRVLTDTLVLRGSVVPALSVEVAVDRTVEGGQPVVTALPLKVGARVDEGARVIEVSGRPVFVLSGTVPVYRDLRPGSHGADVAQLQDALRRLGFDPGETDGVFGPGTKVAVSDFYNSAGYEPPSAGSQQSLRDAEARVTASDDQVAAAREALASVNTSPVEGGGGASGLQRALERATTAAAQARQALAEVERVTGAMFPQSEIVFVDGLPGRVDSVGVKVGQTPEGPLLAVSSGGLVVQAQLTTAERPLVKLDAGVTVESEVLGTKLEAHVAEIGELNTSNETGPQSTFAMRVEATQPIDSALLNQDVRLTIRGASSDVPVLVVPLAAVSSGADGSSRVVRVSTQDSEEVVPVRAGLSANGFVAVEPTAGTLDEGDRVLVGRSTPGVRS